MFIETSIGHVQVSRISRIRPARRDASGKVVSPTTLWLTGDSEPVTTHLSEESILTRGIPSVPAQPGFYAIERFCDDPTRYAKTPVVAWRICGPIAEAVCVDDSANTDIILAPDGQVFAVGGSGFWPKFEWLASEKLPA